MKTLIKKLASALCIFALFAALCTQFSAPAYAEYTLPDYIPNAVILSSVGDCITYPKNSSYLSQSEVKVVKAPKGVAVYFYTAPKAEKEYRRSFNIEDGAIVTVLARENGLSCVITENSRGTMVAGWITSTNLVDLCTAYYEPPCKPAPVVPSHSDCWGIEQPKSGSWLRCSETRYVQSEGGVCIYLCCGPGGNYDHFDTISEGEAVTVLAEQNGYAYVNASGRTGWCSARLLTSCTPLIASMPRMDSTHWVLVLSLRNSGLYEACFSGGSYVGYNASGCCVSGKYSLEGRRLTVDGIRFLWNGGEFVSTELQEMSGTWDHYKLIPGHTQFC